MFKLVSFNVNGLNAESKRRQLRKLIVKWKSSVLLIQESKLTHCNRNVIKQIWENEAFDWRAINACGRSGGLITIWDSEIIECLDSIDGAFSLNCIMSNRSDGFQWTLSNVYGPCNRIEKGRSSKN